MKKYFYFVFFVVVLIAGFYFFRSERVVENSQIKYVEVAGVKLKTDLALDDRSRAQGLSGRAELKEDESMLFVFDNSGKYSFWMKDMNFPIDIIWIDEDMRVVYIKESATPESYPDAFGPTENAKYVLEVVSGFAEKNNLEKGSAVKFSN